MNYQELMTQDRSLPPVVVQATDRTEFMKKCDGVRENFINLLKQLYTDESNKWLSFSEYWQNEQAIVGNAIARHFKIPTKYFPRRDFKAVVAYGVYEFYVKCRAKAHWLSVNHEFVNNRDTPWVNEMLHQVTNECYQMIMLNNMENK